MNKPSCTSPYDNLPVTWPESYSILQVHKHMADIYPHAIG